MTSDEVAIVVVCGAPPAAELAEGAAEFGVQDKQEMLQPGAPLPDGSVRFTFAAQVRGAPGDPDFGGAFVHGPRGGRFIYLGYRLRGGGAWVRRWKVPLAGVDPATLGEARRAGHALVGRVNADAKKATVPPLGGWAAGPLDP